MTCTLVSNNCIAAAAYKHQHVQYTNPFMWSLISPQQFIQLAKDFQTIDFRKWTFIRAIDADIRRHDGMPDVYDNRAIAILFDSKYSVLYNHHQMNPANIMKIVRRIKRFLSLKLQPFFIMNSNNITTEKHCIEFLDLGIDNSIVISPFSISHERHLHKDHHNVEQQVLAHEILIPYLHSKGIEF